MITMQNLVLFVTL